MQVACGTLVGGPGLLGCIVLSLQQLGTQQCDGFGTRARRLALRREPAFAKRHRNHGLRHDHGFVHFIAPRLGDHRLARNQSARSVARMDGRDAVTAQPVHERIARVVGIDGAKFRLHGRGCFELHLIVWLVECAGKPHDRTSVHETWGRHDAVNHTVAGRDRRAGRGTHACDVSVRTDDDDAVFDRRPVHGVKRVRPDGDLCGGRSRQQRKEDRDRREPESGESRAHWSSSSSVCSTSSRVAPSAADGNEVVRRVGEVEDLAALDPGLLDARVDAEGIAGQHDEVSVLARRQ